MNSVQKLVLRIAAAVISAMVVYVPADQVLNGHILGFEYRFLWQLGADSKNLFNVFTPNYGLLAVQIFGFSMASIFLVKSLRS